MKDIKIATEFKNRFIKEYDFKELNYCIKCGRVTSQKHDRCRFCKTGKYIKIEDLISQNVLTKFILKNLIYALLFILGFIFCSDYKQLLVMLITYILAIIVHFLIYIKNKELEKSFGIYKFIDLKKENIRAGMKSDFEFADKDFKEGLFKESYDKLLVLSQYYNTDKVKTKKIQCLKNFVLRNDMELELESLVKDEYDLDLVIYINECLKLKKELIKKNVIEYVIKYEELILEQEKGKEIISNVLSAMLRMKVYIKEYREFIIKDFSYIKKDRILRLWNILKNSKEQDLEELKDKVKVYLEAEGIMS